MNTAPLILLAAGGNRRPICFPAEALGVELIKRGLLASSRHLTSRALRL